VTIVRFPLAVAVGAFPQAALNTVVRPDLSFIAADYFGNFDDPDRINEGWYFVWAWLAYLTMPGAQLVSLDSCPPPVFHALVKIGDLYYDSSRPQGVLHPRHLRVFEKYGLREDADYMEMTPEAFKKHWAHNDGRFKSQNLEPWPESLPDPTTR